MSTYDGSLKFDTSIDEKGFENDFKSFGSKIGSVVKGVALGYTGKTLVQYFIGNNADMEQYLTSFETMLGSAEKAKSLMGDLTQMASVTPFETSDLANATKTLMAFGISANDVMGDLQVLGDISQGNAEKFNSLALVFGQISSAGKLTGQDLLQLINVGFNPLQTISEKTGRSMADLRKDMENGQISFQMVADAMKSATSEGGLFYQAMEKQSKTMTGMLSTLKDNLAQFGRDAGEKAFGQVKDSLQGLLDMIDEASKNGTLDAIAEDIGNALNALISTLISAAKFLYEYKDAVLAGAAAMGVFKASLSMANFVSSASKALGSLKSIMGAGAEAASGTAAAVTSAGSAIAMVGAAIGVIYGGVKIWGESVDYLNNKAVASQKQAEQLQSNIDDTKTKLTELNSKISEIKDKGTITLVDEKQLKALEDQKEVLEATLDLNEKMFESQKLVAEQDATAALNNKRTGTSALKLDIQAYKDDFESAKKVNDDYVKAVESGNTELANSQKSYVEGVAPRLEKDKEILLSRKEQLTNIMGGISGLTDEGKKAKSELQSLIDEINNLLNIDATTSDNNPAVQTVSVAAQYYEEQGKAKVEQAQRDSELSDEAFKKELDTIESQHTRGLMSDEQYYNQKSALLKKYGKDQLSDYDSFYGSIASAKKSANEKLLSDQKQANEKLLAEQEKAQKEQVNVISDSLEKIKSEYKSQYDDIMSQQEQYAEKLSSVDMFSRETVGEKDNVLVLTNFQQKYEELQQYQSLIDQVREKGASTDFVSQIKDMGVTDAVDYMQTLLSSDNIDAQFKAFEAYNAEANKIASDEYKSQVDNVQQNFVDEVTNVLGTLPEQAGKIGTDTATAFANALANSDLLEKIKASLSLSDINNFVATVIGHANSQANSLAMSSNVVKSAATAPTQPATQSNNTLPPININNKIDLDGKTIAQSTTTYQNGATYQNGKRVN